MTLDIKPIRTAEDHKAALAAVKRLWDAEPGTPEDDALDIIVTLIEAYEDEHFPMNLPDPIEAIKFRMEQQGLSRKDLESAIGPRHRVAEVINRKRNLTLSMIRKLNAQFNIPAEVLIQPIATIKKTGLRKAP